MARILDWLKKNSIVLAVLTIVGSLFGFVYHNFLRDEVRCDLELTTRENIRAKVAFAGEMKPGVLLNPVSQELFYELTLETSPKVPITGLSIELSGLYESDAIHAQPTSGVASELTPDWADGKPDPTRENPDFYTQIVRFPSIGPTDAIQGVSVVRQLAIPALADSRRVRAVRAWADDCRVQIEKIEPKRPLGETAKLLFQSVYDRSPDGGVPIAPPPSTPGVGQVRAFSWASCGPGDCSGLFVESLGVERGPYRSEAALSEIEGVMSKFIPCTTKSTSVHPDRTEQSWEVCGGGQLLSAEEANLMFQELSRAGVGGPAAVPTPTDVDETRRITNP